MAPHAASPPFEINAKVVLERSVTDEHVMIKAGKAHFTTGSGVNVIILMISMTTASELTRENYFRELTDANGCDFTAKRKKPSTEQCLCLNPS